MSPAALRRWSAACIWAKSFGCCWWSWPRTSCCLMDRPRRRCWLLGNLRPSSSPRSRSASLRSAVSWLDLMWNSLTVLLLRSHISVLRVGLWRASVSQGGQRVGKRSEHPNRVGLEVGWRRLPGGASVLRHRLLALRPSLRRRPGDHRQPDPHQPQCGPTEDHRGCGRDSLQKTPQVRDRIGGLMAAGWWRQLRRILASFITYLPAGCSRLGRLQWATGPHQTSLIYQFTATNYQN